MTFGVIWEFFEFGMDYFFELDMQKDTIVHAISSVMLDPAGGNSPTVIKDITDVVVQGQNLGLGGYLDIGLIDTMKDLLVNFIGAAVFSGFGYFYVKTGGSTGGTEDSIHRTAGTRPGQLRSYREKWSEYCQYTVQSRKIQFVP